MCASSHQKNPPWIKRSALSLSDTTPTSIVISDYPSPPLRRCELQSIRRSSAGPYRYTEAEDETTTEKVAIILRSSLDGRSSHDDQGTSGHADSTAEEVAYRASEERANHVAHRVYHEDTIVPCQTFLSLDSSMQGMNQAAAFRTLLTCRWTSPALCGESTPHTVSWH